MAHSNVRVLVGSCVSSSFELECCIAAATVALKYTCPIQTMTRTDKLAKNPNMSTTDNEFGGENSRQMLPVLSTPKPILKTITKTPAKKILKLVIVTISADFINRIFCSCP